jgi:hypothetical protein
LVMDYFGSDPKMFAKPVPKRPPEDTSSDTMGGSGIR